MDCVGLTPLLMRPVAPEVLDQIRRGVQVQARKDWTIEEEARSYVYRDGEGNIVVPRANYYSCLVGAGTKVKFKGRSNISTKDSTIFPMLCTIVEEHLVLGRCEGSNFIPLTDKDWIPDMRPGRNKEGNIVPIVRPKFPQWAFRATLIIDDSEIDVSKI